MMKKYFLTAALSLGLAIPAFSSIQEDNAEVVEVAEVVGATCDSSACAGDCDKELAWEETVMVVEGEDLAPAASGRLTQQQKAENAAKNDPWGFAVTAISMCIVVGALIVLWLLFYCFGKISQNAMSKKKAATNAPAAAAAAISGEKAEVDSAEVIAAIGMALSEHFGGGHDVEDTILTIRRLNRAYSPWSSKIYNIRTAPQLHKNTPDHSAF